MTSELGPRRVLVFGGSFDPPHRAHVEIPALVAARLDCDLVVYVPAARNPLKEAGPRAADEHRLAMLGLATSHRPAVEISPVEIERGGPSYFVETLEQLRRRFGDEADLRFLVGADQALDFRRWKDWRRILTLAEPVVVLRPPWDAPRFRRGLDEALGAAEAEQWVQRTVDAPRLADSATTIRQQLRAGDDPGPALDPAVAEYIAAHGLYR